MIKKPFILFICIISFWSGANGQIDSQQTLSELRTAINDQSYPNIESILISTNDKLIVEEYYGKFTRDSLHDTRSAFKSVLSILTGIAIDKGYITLNDTILQYFPDDHIADRKDSRKQLMTVKDLLQMRSGQHCEEFYGIGPDCETEMWDKKDWIDYCLNVEMQVNPGHNWSYSSIPPMLLGEVISRATSMSIMSFADSFLFRTLGIADYKWTLSPKGRGMTAGSFFIKPMDMLKIGELVYNEGRWGNKQIVSQEWLIESTDCQLDIDFAFLRFAKMDDAIYRSATYGYYWYKEVIEFKDIKTEVLFASGNGGQYIMILADYDAVVVFTGGNYGNWRGKLPFEILLKYLIPLLVKS